MHGDFGWLMMAGMWLVWIVPLAAAMAAWSARRPREAGGSPIDLIKEKYARGQMTRDEFFQAKKDLT